MAEIAVGEGHNGAALSIEVGDHIVVRLPENPTTGFQSSAERANSDALQLQSDEFAPAAGGGPGSSGVRALRYLAIGAGDTFIALQLARSWEANAPQSRFKIQVTISSNR